ncbi:MAG: bifunctional (p)ppGpp synthetase/guanosine-3',5'-bis(diphosphate) 3'-pyrophosphohydrolase [Lachnospiraceae bacterium]|nr:bifunctional (p)ppGpp synthetase/guanosine-3',5'-bis(diphosphate) 3'-pyrophosphohydrolase [Lachnospiraceae bacterium]
MTEEKKEQTALDHTMVERELEAPADFTSPETLYEELKNAIRAYHPSTDFSTLDRAYAVAKAAHEGQKRKSGEPYIIHPLCVCIILADLELDKETILAGLLHDVVEDTAMTFDDVKEQFGEEVAVLVDGVTKLTQLNYDADKVEVQAENLRKMFLSMAKDIRVILIKLADRLHNMRTMDYQSPAKQKEKSRETMDIYSPIAARLGISKIKVELDDLALKYLEPEIYRQLSELLKDSEQERTKFVEQILEDVKSHLAEAGIEARVDGRVKHLFSIYKKMVNKQKTLDQIYDQFAIRIIVDDLKDCYAALGIIHEMYTPIPGRFKDYIAMPKPNMYQSLHTTLLSSDGRPFEIQIRTYEMHRTAEYGIAAHWKYKENPDGKSADSEEAKLAWLRQILEWQRDLDDNQEFLNLIKSDLNLFSENVYCFTPTGDVKTLPAGSTPIDFAYSVHSAVGNKMVGARINGKLVPIDYTIQNGDQIEIITSQNSRGPSRDWLKVVKSTQARNKINQWFKSEFKEDNIVRGKELINSYCKSRGILLSDLMKPEYLEKCLKKYGFKDWDSMCAAVGHGGLKEGQIINKLLDEQRKKEKRDISDAQILASLGDPDTTESQVVKPERSHKKKSGITVEGMHDLAVRFSRCCNPVPGDEIVGFVTRGRGVSIHRTDCINVINLPEHERERLIDAEWSLPEDVKPEDALYSVEIMIYANNRTGMLVDISRIFTENGIDMKSLNCRTSKQGTATINIGFEVGSVDFLNSIIGKVRGVAGVLDIQRV